MESLFQDVRYAMRTLAKNRGFSVVTVLTLALGLGVTTAAFSFIDAVLDRPQPSLNDPSRLVALYAEHRDTPEHDYRGVSYPDYPAYRNQAVFQDLAVYLRYPVIAKTPVDNVLVAAEIVTGNYFQVVGPEIIRGRPLRIEDDVWRARRWPRSSVIDSGTHTSPVIPG